jgi:hypothetical protein
MTTSPLQLAALWALAAVGIDSCAFGGGPNLDRVPGLLHNTKAKVLMSTASIPPWILKICRDREGKIAEPGAEWNATDVVQLRLPWARLQWAVTDGSLYVVRCEVGGFASHYQTVVAGPKINHFRNVQDDSYQDLNSPEKVSAFVRHVAPQLAQ